MRRFLPTARRLTAALAVGVVAGFAVAAMISSPASATGRGSPEVYTNNGCVSAKDARYQHTFDVLENSFEAVATIAVHGEELCAGEQQPFALASYITRSGDFEMPQYLFDSQVGTITHEMHQLSFKITIPQCFYQVDFVFGDVVLKLDGTDGLYRDRKVGSRGAPGNQSTAIDGSKQEAWENGGSKKKCKVVPEVEAVSVCDGSMRVTLRHIPGAYVTQYAILRGTAEPMTVDVTPADENGIKIVKVPAGDLANVIVKFGRKEVGNFTWRLPQGCADIDVKQEHDCTELRIIVTNPPTNGPIVARVDTPADATAQAQMATAVAAGTPVTINGGSSHTFRVPGSANLDVTLLIDGVGRIIRYLKPAECGGGGGGLPVTGARTGLLIGGGIGLVAVGAGLFLMFRRRRVTFTVS